MKIQTLLNSCILLMLVALAVPVAADNNANAGGTSYVYVSSVTMDPEVFYPYEQGTVTVTLTNNGNTSIGVLHPAILSASDDLSVVDEDTWQTASYIGSSNSISYSFLVTVNKGDGKYFGLFSIETLSADGAATRNIHYPLCFEVDSSDLTAAISRKPETFTIDSESSVNLSLINQRDGAINGIVITAQGNGADITPTQTYITTIADHTGVEVPFAITPYKATNVTFNITYKNGNGNTDRQIILDLPITTGTAKSEAVPVINNLALTSKGSYYDLTGDISNSGITDAKGLVVTTGSPAKGTGTYPEYAIGSLASDDSSSFEISFSCADLSAVPLVLHWKDSEGTDYSVTKTLDLSSSLSSGGAGTSSTSRTAASGSTSMAGGPGGMGGPGGDMNGPPGSSSSSTSSVLSSITSAKGGGISSFYPVIAMVVLIIAGAVAYKKRKWLLAKLKRQ